MIELNEKSAQDLNDLLEYSCSLPSNVYFNVGHFTKDVLGGQTSESYTYYMALTKLAERLMAKYNSKWIGIDHYGDIRTTWETRAFLDQGGFIALLKKEKPKWADAHPLADKFRTGAITALFSLTVGTILWLLANQKQAQVNTQLMKRLDSLEKKVYSLSNKKKN